MLRINQLRVPWGRDRAAIRRATAEKLGVSKNQIAHLALRRHAIDCRKKPELFDSYAVDVELKDPRQERRILRARRRDIVQTPKETYCLPAGANRPEKAIVCGSGPAGLFCADVLSRCGVQVTVLERGSDVDRRQKIVESFWAGAPLDPRCNVQFGEGGAGTFSDGKLNTLVKDKNGRSRYVLETFVRHGAPADILMEHKPHVGTDRLRGVIKGMREELIQRGVTFMFDTTLADIDLNRREAITGSGLSLPYDRLVLAIGHSARDTFAMLAKKGMRMHAKAFAAGLRIIHPQEVIDRSQYGRPRTLGDQTGQSRGAILPAAAYKLSRSLSDGRGGYTFCMCPGGYVVNASSEDGHLAVNGMSYHDRAGRFANSAVIVSVNEKDFPAQGPMGGILFQRQLEAAAYRAAGGAVPVQTVGDFLSGRLSPSLPDLKYAVKGACRPADLSRILPSFLAEDLRETIRGMGRLIDGFDAADALLCGVESRTSSPVRIERDERGMSSLERIYPCGEGAGFAGGIMSAAMDGMKIAEHILADPCPM